jgi:hypothetical protein
MHLEPTHLLVIALVFPATTLRVSKPPLQVIMHDFICCVSRKI